MIDLIEKTGEDLQMRKKLAASVLMMAMAFSLAACTQDTAQIESTEMVEETVQEVVTIENVTSTETLTVLGDSVDMEISYPKVRGLNDQILMERINKTIRQAFRSENALLAGEANVIEQSYEVTHQSDEWISIRFDFTTDPSGDGKQTYQLFTSFTVDMTTGEPILFHSRWSELTKENQLAFETLLTDSLAEGEVSPITGPETFPEAYINGESLVVYYYDNEMKEVQLPLKNAMTLLIGKEN